MPEVPGGAALLAHFFEMGPAGVEGPLSMREVRSWAEPLTGYEDWPGWQSRLFVRLSREYCAEQHRARDYYALPPWPPAVKMWQWVRAELAERQMDRDKEAIEQRMKEAPANGNRKRH